MENTMMNNVEEAMEEMIPTMPAINQDMAIIEEPKAVAKISKNHKLLKAGIGIGAVYALYKIVGKKVKKAARNAIKGIVREVMAEEAAKGQPQLVEAEVVTAETNVNTEES